MKAMRLCLSQRRFVHLASSARRMPQRGRQAARRPTVRPCGQQLSRWVISHSIMLSLPPYLAHCNDINNIYMLRSVRVRSANLEVTCDVTRS